jgi:hypothetical protein
VETDYAEVLEAVQFGVGGYRRLHNEAFHRDRVLTTLVFLHDTPAGGEVVFPALRWVHKTGAAVVCVCVLWAGRFVLGGRWGVHAVRAHSAPMSRGAGARDLAERAAMTRAREHTGRVWHTLWLADKGRAWAPAGTPT